MLYIFFRSVLKRRVLLGRVRPGFHWIRAEYFDAPPVPFAGPLKETKTPPPLTVRVLATSFPKKGRVVASTGDQQGRGREVERAHHIRI